MTKRQKLPELWQVRIGPFDEKSAEEVTRALDALLKGQHVILIMDRLC